MEYQSFADLKRPASTENMMRDLDIKMSTQLSTSPLSNDTHNENGVGGECGGRSGNDFNSDLTSQNSHTSEFIASSVEESEMTSLKSCSNTTSDSSNRYVTSISNNDMDNIEENSDPVDPRIQFELERLNKACTDINKLENELEESKNIFIQTKNHQLQRLEFLQKKLGSCISKAKPYYELLKQTQRLQRETQLAVQEFQKANSLYKTAKETLSVAEHSLNKGEIPDAWQEHLSATITKISLSKKSADKAEEFHRNKAQQFQSAEQRLLLYQKDYKRSILKSQPYYEEKSRWTNQMETQKSRINELENAIVQTKAIYKEAMRNLSKISEEIHEKRRLDKMRQTLPPREPGVGAEKPEVYFDSTSTSTELTATSAIASDNQSSRSLRLDEFSPIEATTQKELETSLAHLRKMSDQKRATPLSCDKQSSINENNVCKINVRLEFEKELEELEMKENSKQMFDENDVDEDVDDEDEDNNNNQHDDEDDEARQQLSNRHKKKSKKPTQISRSSSMTSTSTSASSTSSYCSNSQYRNISQFNNSSRSEQPLSTDLTNSSALVNSCKNGAFDSNLSQSYATNQSNNQHLDRINEISNGILSPTTSNNNTTATSSSSLLASSTPAKQSIYEHVASTQSPTAAKKNNLNNNLYFSSSTKSSITPPQTPKNLQRESQSSSSSTSKQASTLANKQQNKSSTANKRIETPLLANLLLSHSHSTNGLQRFQNNTTHN